MAPIDAPKTPEGNPEGKEKPITPEIAQEAEAVAQVLSEPEELNVDIILQDLGIQDKNSPEAKYFEDVVSGLNKKMKSLNSDAQGAVKSFPSYFKNTNQMEMQWDGGKRQLTIVSQGEEVIKFEIGKKEPLVEGKEKKLGIYMKNLLVAEQSIDKTDDIDPQDFLNFATQNDTQDDNTNEWGLFSFSDMYGGVENKKGYLQSYSEYANNTVSTSVTKNIRLAPGMTVLLESKAVSGPSVRIDNIFGNPKPLIVEITSPNKSSTLAFLQSNGTYLDDQKRRPLIYTGSLVKNITSFEDMQTVVENDVFSADSPIQYTMQDIFPNISAKSKRFQEEAKRYFDLFHNSTIELETNKSGMRTYVDMTDESYVLRYELNNQYLNRPYNKDLVMDLTGVLTYKKGAYVFNREKFKTQMAQKIETIITHDFLLEKNTVDEGIIKKNFIDYKQAGQISAGDQTYGSHNNLGERVGRCSEATQHVARDQFGLQLPSGKGTALLNILTTPTDSHYKASKSLSGKTGLKALGLQAMYDLLSAHLDKGCTVVDIGYISHTKIGKKYNYGHRNLAYYCYDTREWYIIDPVANYGRGVTKKGIPLSELKTNIFSPRMMRYYAPSVGVYEKQK